MAISVLQHIRRNPAPSPVTQAITVSAGSAIILVTTYDTVNTITVSDTVNTWTGTLGSVIRTLGGLRGQCQAAYNVAAGTITVTVTNAGGGFLDFELFEVSGLATTAAFDLFVGTTVGTGHTGTVSDTGTSAATAQASEISICLHIVDTNTTVADNGQGYTMVDVVSQDMTAGYLILSATGTQQSQGSLGASVGWGAGLWTFEAATTTTPTPKPASEQLEARANRKTTRVALLRERGKGWFQAIFPAVFPLRNTTLVPAKWLGLSSIIGSGRIQRATTGVIAAIFQGRSGDTRRAQRSIASSGRLRAIFPAIFPPRNTTTVPAKWVALSSLIGAGSIQRATTGVIAALFTGRDHGDKVLTRKLRAAGRAIGLRWLPQPPPPPTPRPANANAIGRTRGERNAERRARASGHVLAQRWLPAPPIPPTPKPILCVVAGRMHGEHARSLRQATVIFYDTAFLVVPTPNTPALPGAHGVTVTFRAERAHRAKAQHERAAVSARAPRVILPPPTPLLPVPRSVMTERRTAWAERAHVRHERHQSFAGTQILLGARVPPPPPAIVVDDRRRRWRGAVY